jgi:hypothetical protein
MYRCNVVSFLKTKVCLRFFLEALLGKYPNKVPRQMAQHNSLILFYIFGIETHLFNNQIDVFQIYCFFEEK